MFNSEHNWKVGTHLKTPLNVKKPKPGLSVIGWVEHIALPELDLPRVKAKVDTGARTSALHTAELQLFEQDELEMVRFHLRLKNTDPERWFEAAVHGRRMIKNTGGVPEERIIIRTPIVLAGRKWMIDVSLANRANMRLPMIVGRSALKGQNIAVHPGRSKLARE